MFATFLTRPINMRVKPPLHANVIQQLRSDALNVYQTARRKQLDIDAWAASRETRFAKEHFLLGCWLHYYVRRIGKNTPEGFESRVKCAARIFMSGITNPSYDFHTVFDFGERDFEALFDFDGDRTIEALRAHLAFDTSGNLAKAFQNFGWPQ